MPAIGVEGAREAQEANQKMIAALKPNSTFGQAIKVALAEAYRYTVSITHVITGRLKASHRMIMESGLRGRIYIDPAVVGDPTPPVEYGVHEHNRGGGHSFYSRTVAEDGANAARMAAEALLRGLPR